MNKKLITKIDALSKELDNLKFSTNQTLRTQGLKMLWHLKCFKETVEIGNTPFGNVDLTIPEKTLPLPFIDSSELK